MSVMGDGSSMVPTSEGKREAGLENRPAVHTLSGA